MNAINQITVDDVWTARDLNERGVFGFNDYAEIACKSAIYPGQGTPFGLDYVALKLNGEAGEFAEHVGKAFRDDAHMVLEAINEGGCYVHFNPLTEERREFLVKEAGDCLWYLAAICKELKERLSDVALENIEKLASRTERGKLQGSGDKR